MPLDPAVAEDLMNAVESIADMARRFHTSGPVPTYATKKLAHAGFKVGEAVALCGVSLEWAVDHLCEGFERGEWLRS